MPIARQKSGPLVIEDELPNKIKVNGLFQEEFNALPDFVKNRYDFDKRTRMYNMCEPEWLKQRQHWIHYDNPSSTDYIPYTVTSSESGIVACGSEFMKSYLEAGEKEHPFMCLAELTAKKKGKSLALHKAMDNDNLKKGGHLEEPKAIKAFENIWADEHPLDIVECYQDGHMYQCGRKDENGRLKYPWALAEPDMTMEVNGEIVSCGEVKNINFRSPDYDTVVKRNKMPFIYYVQGLWEMFVTNLPSVYFIVCTGNTYPNDYHVFYLERDFDTENELIKICENYVQRLEAGEEIPEDGSDGQQITKLYEYWRKKNGNFDETKKPVTLTADDYDAVEELSIINEQIEAYQQKISSLKAKKEEILVSKIFPKVGDANVCYIPITSSKRFELTLKSETKRTLDVDQVKENEPDAYKNCLIPKFDSTLFKKDYPDLYEKYSKVSGTLSDKKKDFCKIKIVNKAS